MPSIVRHWNAQVAQWNPAIQNYVVSWRVHSCRSRKACLHHSSNFVQIDDDCLCDAECVRASSWLFTALNDWRLWYAIAVTYRIYGPGIFYNTHAARAHASAAARMHSSCFHDNDATSTRVYTAVDLVYTRVHAVLNLDLNLVYQQLY